MRWGEGTQKVGESGDVLVGRWERDQLNGRGRLLGGNGEAYDGEFRGGVRDGEGECVYAGGAVYRGQWADGACEGHGRLQNGEAYYEGGWHLGEMCGHATRKYESGEVYNGEFARGLRHGAGAPGARCGGHGGEDGALADVCGRPLCGARRCAHGALGLPACGVGLDAPV